LLLANTSQLPHQ